MKTVSRREVLKTSVIGSVLGMIPFSAFGLTPPQTEGPFHPGNLDTDLTRKSPNGAKAKGQIIYLNGQVVDEQNQPVSNALVELWQAGDNGRYNHPTDPNPLPIDPNFQYWGRATTNARGQYQFKTIVPGHYPATDDWMRPAHIHFRVMRRGFHDLTTQMYFKANTASEQNLLDKDAILQALSPTDQAKVVIDFQPAPATGGFEANSKVGFFKIEIDSVRRR